MEKNNKQIGFLENIIYGVAMGIFEVVPGISGGTLALILGIYEPLINSISNLKKNFKKSFKILFPIIIGMGFGVYSFSFILSFLNKKCPMEVSFWLTGLIIGIIPSITKEAFNNLNTINGFKIIEKKDKIFKYKCIISFFAFILTIVIMLIVNYLSFKMGGKGEIVKNLDFLGYLKFLSVGSVAAFCLMLPGCSGSLIMLVFGIYFSVIEAIHSFNFKILITVGIGVLLGLFFGAKIISYFLKNFKYATFFAILGLIIGSSVSPFLNFLKNYFSILNFQYLIFHGIFSVLVFSLGYIFSFYFSKNFR